MKQVLYLSISESAQAIQSKDRLESLAFAMLIKLTFVSSTVNNTKISYLKDLFHIGSTRMCRILKNGQKFGYLTKDNKGLHANKIRLSKDYNIRLQFDAKTFKNNKCCSYRLNDLMDIIRKSILLNHISKQDDLAYTKISLENPRSVKELRSSRKKFDRMLHSGKVYKGLSNKRIMDLTNTYKAKAKRLTRSLIASKTINKEEVSVDTNIPAKEFSKKALAWFKETGNTGYLYRKFFHTEKGELTYKIMCRLSNIYTLNSDLIQFKA